MEQSVLEYMLEQLVNIETEALLAEKKNKSTNAAHKSFYEDREVRRQRLVKALAILRGECDAEL